MIEWLTNFWETLTWSRILWGSLITVVSVAITYGLIIFGLVKIPADYFSSAYYEKRAAESRQHFFLRWSAAIVKNIVGFLLIVAGVIMIFTPGPGVPTILLGLIVMDFPGKRPLEAKLIAQPAVLATINHLRSRYNKPPLVLD